MISESVITCPKCGKAMMYLKSIPAKGLHAESLTVPIYDCPQHGPWRRDPDAVFRPDDQSIH